METTIILSDHILYEGQKITEEDALLKIKEGALLSSFTADGKIPLRSVNDDGSPRYFTGVTPLMSFAAITYHKEGYKEILDEHWSKALAKYAVKKDYNAVSFIPLQLRPATAQMFDKQRQRLDRTALTQWVAVLNEQSDDFIRAVVTVCPQNIRYVDEKRKKDIERTVKLKPNMTAPKKKPAPAPVLQTKPQNKQVTILYHGNHRQIITAEEFLAMNKRDQQESMLDALVRNDKLLPDDFLKVLLLPLRNASFYRKRGDMQRAEEWKKKALPYITKEKVLWIADVHAEAAITTPVYLTSQGVDKLFQKIDDNPNLRKEYFLKIPEKFLKKEYLHDIYPSTDTFAHAPSLYKDSQEFYKYIIRHPAEILKLPDYQTAGLLLKDGVYLDRRNIKNVKDPMLQYKLALALNFEEYTKNGKPSSETA